MKVLKKILFLLTRNERKRAILIFLMILLMAFLDMIGVASILPFIAILTNPSLLETNAILSMMFQYSEIFGVKTQQEFLFALGILVFILLVFSLVFKALTYYAQSRFVQMREYSIGKRLIEGYLHQPYSWFLNRNSAEIGKSILSEVGIVVSGGLRPMMELIANSMVTIALLTLLIIANPYLSLIVGFSLCGAYGIIYKFTRDYLNRIGQERLESNEKRFTSITEAFGAAKEVKVGGLEQTYIKRFAEPAYTFARHQVNAEIVKQLPRFALEMIAFGGMLLIILYLIKHTGTFITALPVIALFAYAGYRLIPAIQQIYSAVTQLRYLGPSLDTLYDDLKSLKPFNSQDQGVLSFNKKITLKNISYNYPNTSRTTLKGINFDIPVKTTVGLVGVTGSGKTTVVDIILGLLEAQQGTLEVDGKVINKQNSRAWQKSIGYVPQYIYLADDTIGANIAFGAEPKDINQKAVEKASKIANLHEFVINELPNQYQTTIGERGIRLSGGQRQRIGIARALYHNPKVLILDEATSALDNQTEMAVMEAVNNLSKDITIILIAHRLNTVKNCDFIFKLDKGQLVSQLTFNELINDNEYFSSS